jgi:uncharacterized protein (TIGR00369 family)
VTSSAVDTVPREQVYPTGVDRDEIRERNAAAMADSQLTATIAALTAAGYDLEGEGARVVMVAEDAVTDEIREDDLIVAVQDDLPVTDSTDVVEAVQANEPGDPFVVHLIRNGERMSVELELGSAPDDPERAYIGIMLMTEIDMPVEIVIDAGTIGGPSGGLIFALADSAFAFACNSHNQRTVAQHCAITFLAPAKRGDVLTAAAEERARAVREGKHSNGPCETESDAGSHIRRGGTEGTEFGNRGGSQPGRRSAP